MSHTLTALLTDGEIDLLRLAAVWAFWLWWILGLLSVGWRWLASCFGLLLLLVVLVELAGSHCDEHGCGSVL